MAPFVFWRWAGQDLGCAGLRNAQPCGQTAEVTSFSTVTFQGEVLVVLEEGVLWETEGKTRTGVWKGQGQEGMGVEWGGKHSPWVTSEGGREGCQ